MMLVKHETKFDFLDMNHFRCLDHCIHKEKLGQLIETLFHDYWGIYMLQ
jgi:hypothetical protein